MQNTFCSDRALFAFLNRELYFGKAQIIEPLSLKAVVRLRLRTVSTILVWVAIALLLFNVYFGSTLIFLACIALVVVAVAVYFVPRFRKGHV